MDQFYSLIKYYYDLQKKNTQSQSNLKDKDKDPNKTKEEIPVVQGAVTLGHDAYIYDA